MPEKKQTIESLQQDLAEQKQHQKELEQQAKNIEKELNSMRSDLVKGAAQVQKSESSLQKLEDKISTLENEKLELLNSLEQDKKQISHLVLALQRIGRVPPQALILRPGAPLEAAQSALLMGNIIPSLQRQSNMLRDNIERLDKITSELENKKRSAIKTKQDLQKEQDKLARIVDKKEQLYKETNSDLKARQQEVERISREAKSLSELMSKLRQERTRGQNEKKGFAAKPDLPRYGQTQLPIPGHILISYKEPDNFGAPSEGITIEGRSSALVVAPMGGIVRFVGNFKNYGNMVIIEHQNNYHSLIAGFEKIDTLVEQKISGGEPLGTLKKSSGNKKPRLYYELRHKGVPVNPYEKFS